MIKILIEKLKTLRLYVVSDSFWMTMTFSGIFWGVLADLTKNNIFGYVGVIWIIISFYFWYKYDD